jgi:hypothetical protein
VTRLLGTVTGPNGERIDEASVYFMEGPVPLPDIAQLTNEQGEFRMAAPVPGTYRIGVRAGDLEPVEVTVEVGDEPEQAVEITVPGSTPPSP